MRFLILFIFLTTNTFASDISEIKNLIIHKIPKIYENLIFLDKKNQKINIQNFQNNLIILNFWATWCAPCKEEMPSLDTLQINPNLDNIKIFAINIGKENKKKVDKFFKKLDIKNIESYYDASTTLAKKLSLRGVPTSILINKNGMEFARIIGSIDFDDEKFINWLKFYN